MRVSRGIRIAGFCKCTATSSWACKNARATSATGVAFTRDPASGEKVFYGEYLINAQGEDVVAGVRTPHPIAHLAKEMPAAHKALMKVRKILEQHFKDMQDLEFTVEENRLYILQTRNV